MEMCARCKKRPATVYIMKLENNEQKQEGLCLVCAKELGIKPVNDIMKKMGISDEELENMEKLMSDMLPMDTDSDDDGDSPTIDFGKLMRNAGFMQATAQSRRRTVRRRDLKRTKEKILIPSVTILQPMLQTVSLTELSAEKESLKELFKS